MYESPHIFLYQFGHNYNAIYHFSCVRATFLLQLNGLFTCLPEIDIQITYLDDMIPVVGGLTWSNP